MTNESRWKAFNVIFLLGLAVGIGIFLRVWRGMSIFHACLYTVFFAILFVLPTALQMGGVSKAASTVSNRYSLQETLKGFRDGIFTPRRLVKFLVLFISVPILGSGIALLALRFGFYSDWVPLGMFALFIVGTILIFRIQR